jgi:hypothetical protein
MPRFWYIGETMARKLAEAPHKKKRSRVASFFFLRPGRLTTIVTFNRNYEFSKNYIID